MTDLSWLDNQASAEWFGESTYHEPVPLQHIPGARILWLNREAALADSLFCGDLEAYERQLLASCAFLVAQPEEIAAGAAVVTGYADRYGGSGIGSNGGSGRATVVNGYLVKGVGRTRLVSALTDQSHASGGAYLAESVRETIYGEIVRAEFPHSAVPVLAIIDTGLVQVWDHAFGPAVERRTLVVRPCFVRPAHFLRATGFISEDPKEGQRDRLRVQAMFTHARSTLGEQGFANAYENLWRTWARQLAYAFIHRLPHGSNTMSNICFDGKLLDFGATSAVPSWANTATMMARHSFASQTGLLRGLISSTGYYFGRYFNARYASEAEQAKLSAITDEEYRRTLMVEGLRLCGLPRSVAERAVLGPQRQRILSSLYTVIKYFQGELVDMVEATPSPRLAWDLTKLWQADPPQHLSALQAVLLSLVSPDAAKDAELRCALLSATRDGHFREEAKDTIHAALDRSSRREEPDRAQIEQFICRQVAMARRDHRLEVDGAVTIGFAIGNATSYVLLREHAGDRTFAVRERANAVGQPTERHVLQTMTADMIVFAEHSLPPFSGAVHLPCKTS